VSIAIFNSAGEKVKLVYSGLGSSMANQITVSPGSGSGGPASIVIGGVVVPGGGILTWDGDNDSGQWVSNGVYYLQVSSTDSFGSVQTVSQALPVLGTPRTASMQVYNSAGEMVRHIPVPNLSSLPTDFSVSSSTFVTGTDSSGRSQGGLQINLKVNNGGSASTLPLSWDGLSDGGEPVSSGTYLVKLTYMQAGMAMAVKTVAVTLLQGPGSPAKDAAASAVIAPNPFKAGPGKRLEVFYKVPASGMASVRVYSLSGELVAQSGDANRTGKLAILGDLSSGVYLVDFEVRQGAAVLAQRVLKAAVVR
jgi:flagellar hook assembly protein FlgD